jgi:hypothetical protein
MFKFSQMLRFTSDDMKRIAHKTAMRHRDQIFQGKDANDKPFEKYNERYAENKKAKKFENQINSSTNPVNMTLTGKMLNAFQVIKANFKGRELKFQYGIKKNKQGTKMNQHNEGIPGKLPKRVIADDQALGSKVEEGIVRDFADNVAKNLSRMTKTTYKVTLG